MSNIIDRRLNPRDKTIKNRQKFIQRSREQIKEAVKDAIDGGNIADIENGKARVKVKGISEPEFVIDPKTGNKKYVMPGNDQFIVGDTQKKPQDGQGQGGTKGGEGTSEDDFEFILNQEEFLDFIFEDLELPDLIKKQLKDVTKVRPKRAGHTNVGNPSQLDVVRSLKNSLGRRIGLRRPKDEEITELEQQLDQAIKDNDEAKIIELEKEIARLKSKQLTVPWLDPFDVRYRNFVPTPQPMTKAVMFCIMDVSGSMGQYEKDIAKRFFFFLHMFLRRKYDKVDIVFIRHHESAAEVDEETFFHSRESGGTIVSTALELAKKIIDERYNVNDWNIYVAQSSDGDNIEYDVGACRKGMESILPLVQYFAYLEVRHQYAYDSMTATEVWAVYRELVKEYSNMQIRKANEKQDAWKVFKELFSKEKGQSK
jgi:uncharacterized sporulation protein YeaH/YhbH (DUF444 family)